MNNKLTLGLILTLSLSACGREVYTEYVPSPSPTVTVTPTPVVGSPEQLEAAAIAAIVDEENIYREGLGQTALTNGLSCALYTVTGGQFIQNDATHTPTLTGIVTVATFLFKDAFNQPNSSANDGLNVLPAALRSNPSYKNLILLRCQGQLVVTTTGYVDFDLTSDDGSVLYVDGSRTIDNDGNHGATEKTGQKYLREGVHTFRLDFAQTGAGNQALILKANNSLLSGQYFFH